MNINKMSVEEYLNYRYWIINYKEYDDTPYEDHEDHDDHDDHPYYSSLSYEAEEILGFWPDVYAQLVELELSL